MNTSKSILLGSVSKKTATGGHQPNHLILRQEPRTTEEVVPFFCTGCGTTLSMNAEGAKMLSEAGGNDTGSYDGMYFKVSRCIACGDDFGGVSLERIE